LSGDGRGDYSVLQKIQVSCKTCGVSDAFYSNLSVEQFKSKHRGHEVVGGNTASATSTQSAPVVQEAPSTVYTVKPPPKDELSLDRDTGTKLPKVIVDMVVFPVLPDPVFRVRGFKDDLEEAFITTIRFEHASKVRDMILGGEFIDHDYSGLRYFWEPDSVEYEGNVRARLGLPPRVTKPRAAEPRRELRQIVEDPEAATVAGTNEILFGDSKRIAAPVPRPELQSVSPPDPVVAIEELEAPAPPPAPKVAKETKEAKREPQPATPTPRRPIAPAKVEERKPAQAAPAAALVKPVEEKEGDYLLVSKSWYIQGGAANKNEAIRISKVLKAFRWRVEPVYTIGVILDDMLSIETSRTQVSRTLIQRVEAAGYRLTAVTAEQGKPVAWFKRAENGSTTQDASGDGSAKGAGEIPASTAAPASDDPEEEVEPDVTG